MEVWAMNASAMAAQARGALRRRLRTAAGALLPSAILVRRGRGGSRRAALTIDDGPDPMTRGYLDVLDRFGVPATFFVLGRACAERRDDLLEMIRRGHEVASHGYDHVRIPTLDAGEMEQQLARTAALLPPPLGRRPLFRPPHGAVSSRSLITVARAGYTTVLWSLDSDDCRTRDVDEVVARVAPERVEPGEIVLLHEGQTWTLEALPRILANLRAANVKLVTVGELLDE
jgi:peptidoglycan/xylan/chitin deacetylase (PgdA/CDA1 family)